MSRFSPYLKAVVGALLAGLGALKLALGDNTVSHQEMVEIAIVTLGVLYGVWQTPNKP
jgi:hypothetical protein